MIKYLITILLLLVVITKAQVINKNISRETYIAIYNDTTKQIIDIIEPNHRIMTIYKLKEFTNKEKLDTYIEKNKLIKREKSGVELGLILLDKWGF